jgi:hypothetical protein
MIAGELPPSFASGPLAAATLGTMDQLSTKLENMHSR